MSDMLKLLLPIVVTHIVVLAVIIVVIRRILVGNGSTNSILLMKRWKLNGFFHTLKVATAGSWESRRYPWAKRLTGTVTGIWWNGPVPNGDDGVRLTSQMICCRYAFEPMIRPSGF